MPELRAVLDDHEGMDPKLPPRVYFTEFAADAFTIRMTYWYTPPDANAFNALSEKINLEIFKAFEQRGIQFSLPIRHSYWKTDEEQGPLEVDLIKKSS